MICLYASCGVEYATSESSSLFPPPPHPATRPTPARSPTAVTHRFFIADRLPLLPGIPYWISRQGREAREPRQVTIGHNPVTLRGRTHVDRAATLVDLI